MRASGSDREGGISGITKLNLQPYVSNNHQVAACKRPRRTEGRPSAPPRRNVWTLLTWSLNPIRERNTDKNLCPQSPLGGGREKSCQCSLTRQHHPTIGTPRPQMSSVHLAPESEHSALIFKSNRDADGHNDGHNTMVHTSTTYLEPHRLTTQLHRHPSLIILCESFFFFFDSKGCSSTMRPLLVTFSPRAW